MHINYARVREAELVVFGNVNLAALLFRDQEDDFEDDLEDTEITPIQQKMHNNCMNQSNSLLKTQRDYIFSINPDFSP